MSRIFNLSHQRCATTSVHWALTTLGFKSRHFDNPDHLLRVHLDGCIATDGLLQEDNTAWNDSPLSIMYRSLYEAFPSEIFIFVRRNPEEWVESMRRFILRDWPIPLPIHTLMYGYPMKASNFDSKACLKAYNRICEDILEYFDGKENFHLIDIKDLSWKTLCQAVGKPEPAPEIQFPWENKTKGHEPIQAGSS